MGERIELVEECEHGFVELPGGVTKHAQSIVPGGCPGGTRRVLAEAPERQMCEHGTIFDEDLETEGWETFCHANESKQPCRMTVVYLIPKEQT
jgi:hypothetical protein